MPDYVIAYVYQLSDFSTSGGNITPPDEQGARAQGNPPFNITLNPGAQPIPIIITDGDGLFHETSGTDPSQPLAQAVTIDGVTYPAGSHVVLNYVLTDNGGFEGYSITIGSGNSGNNTTTAFVTTEPMVPGQQYVFTSEGNIGNNNPVDYTEFACFTVGAQIKTPHGLQRIERLRPGDLVMTRDHGAQPLRWIGMRKLPAVGPVSPICFDKGVMGAHRRHLVSPQHRMMLRGPQAELLTGEPEVFVPAHQLVNGRTITRQVGGVVTYVHLALDRHEVLTVDGLLSESLFVKDTGLMAASGDEQAEIQQLFDDGPLATVAEHDALCRPLVKRHVGEMLAAQI